MVSRWFYCGPGGRPGLDSRVTSISHLSHLHGFCLGRCRVSPHHKSSSPLPLFQALRHEDSLSKEPSQEQIRLPPVGDHLPSSTAQTRNLPGTARLWGQAQSKFSSSKWLQWHRMHPSFPLPECGWRDPDGQCCDGCDQGKVGGPLKTACAQSSESSPCLSIMRREGMDHIQKLRGPCGTRNKARIGYMENMFLDICIYKKHSFWREG